MIVVGRSHDEPKVLFCPNTALTLSRLNRSRLACTRRLPRSLKTFDRRKSTWCIRSLNIVPGSIMLMLAVPLQVAAAPHDARLRLSDGAISAFVNGRVAVICGPGRL